MRLLELLVALLRFALDIYVKIGGNTAVDQLAPKSV
jgi:hypothetical protein